MQAKSWSTVRISDVTKVGQITHGRERQPRGVMSCWVAELWLLCLPGLPASQPAPFSFRLLKLDLQSLKRGFVFTNKSLLALEAAVPFKTLPVALITLLMKAGMALLVFMANSTATSCYPLRTQCNPSFTGKGGGKKGIL